MNERSNHERGSKRKIATSDIGSIADKRLSDGTLVFSGKRKITTKLSSDSPIKAPFSGRECVYFRAEGYFEVEGASFHVGTAHSKGKFYVSIKGFLVEVGLVKMEFPPTHAKKIVIGEEQEEIREKIRELWGVSIPSIGRELKIYEWCLYPDKEYLLRVEERGSALPPEEGEKPEVVVSHHFIFKDPKIERNRSLDGKVKDNRLLKYVPLLLSGDPEIRSSAIRELIDMNHGLVEELYDKLLAVDEKLVEAIFRILEGKGEIGLRFLWQDKSGSIYRPFFARELPDELKIRYLIYKMDQDLSSSELECVISELGKLNAVESVPAIIEKAEKASLNCIMAAAKVFGDFKAVEAVDFLLRCLYPGFLESKVDSPFDESKLEEAREMIVWALEKIRKETSENT